MSEGSQGLFIVGLLGGAAGCGLLLTWLFGLPESPVRKAAQAYVDDLNRRYAMLRLPRKGAGILAGQVAAVLSLVVLASLLSPVLLLLVPIVVMAPPLQVRKEYDRRIVRIEQQLDGWMLALANALKAVPSIGEALSSSQRLVHAPLSQELDLALKEYRLGAPLETAFDNMAQRMGSRVVRSALSILRIARNTGGDLPKTLESAAASLREMARLEGVVRTKTADGRNQAFVLGSLPAVVVVLLQLTQPDALQPLFDTEFGHVLLGLAGLLWLGAILLSMNILRVDL